MRFETSHDRARPAPGEGADREGIVKLACPRCGSTDCMWIGSPESCSVRCTPPCRGVSIEDMKMLNEWASQGHINGLREAAEIALGFRHPAIAAKILARADELEAEGKV